MTSLAQRLAETFEHRASLPTGGIAPATVNRAVRRQRARTAVGSVVATIGVVATVALVVSQQQSGAKAVPAGSITSNPPTWQPGTTIASLPFGPGLTVSLRFGEGYGSTTRAAAEFDWCIQATNPEYSCSSEHSDGSDRIDREGDGSGFFGLAPANTTKVVVTVRGEQPVTAGLSKLDLAQPGLAPFDNPGALMFSAPGVTAYLDPIGALTKASTVEAFDGSGKSLAILSSRGTSDLAQAHPPVTSPVPYPQVISGTPRQWFWTAADGWTCLGRAATLSGHQQYGADQCYAPTSTGTQLLRNDSASTSEVFLVRVPAATTSAHLVTHDGQTVDAAILHNGPGHLVVLPIDDSRPVDPIVLTVRNAQGKILSTGEVKNLPMPTQADIVSGG